MNIARRYGNADAGDFAVKDPLKLPDEQYIPESASTVTSNVSEGISADETVYGKNSSTWVLFYVGLSLFGLIFIRQFM
jgi:hypothetical protein